MTPADTARDIINAGLTAALTRLTASGARVVACIGDDLPFPLIRAAGLTPVRLRPITGQPTPFADARGLGITLSWQGRSLLQQISDGLTHTAPLSGLILSHSAAIQVQLFAALRELPELGLTADTVIFCDLLRLNTPSTQAYNRHQLERLESWCTNLGQPFSDDDLTQALDTAASHQKLGRAIREWRAQGLISGTDAALARRAADYLPADAYADLLRGWADGPLPVARTGPRLVLSGSVDLPPEAYAAIEADGATIVAEALVHVPELKASDTPPRERLLNSVSEWKGGAFSDAKSLQSSLARTLAHYQPDGVLHLSLSGDETSPWLAKPLGRTCADTGVPFLAARYSSDLPAHVLSFAAAPSAATISNSDISPVVDAAAPKPEKPAAARPARAPQTRSQKSLTSTADFGAYQKSWFADVQAAVASGSPFALVNANAPQEILRALDIPFVVNQWWASIVAAKRQSKRYAALLTAHDHPADVEPYSAQGLAALYDDDADQAPWGGLPKPDMLHTVPESDATRPLFDAWAEASGSDLYIYERSVETRWDLPENWWDALPDHWDTALQPERLDLMTAELNAMVRRLSAATGRTWDPQKFIDILDLVNSQESYYRRTRDLIAETVPAPVSVVDTMPATMVPQWHRGTVWARDAAKAFYEEVKARVDAGQGVCETERLRLMWVGRGLWSDTAFYQKWQDSHGAVFVWSMYLALAADGYIREHTDERDPMRSLAARFITMGDELRMPTWAGAWHVKEARTNKVDAAIAIDDADPFVLRALEASGIPVLRLPMSNLGQPENGPIETLVTQFLDQCIRNKKQ
ncbi:MAG: 2-hydroxyacyl-CoA dehydratase family protein [Asticcacaulis sp.]